MSESEMIGGGLSYKKERVTQPRPSHDWRKVKRSNPGDTSGAQAANARAQNYTPKDSSAGELKL